MLNAMVSIEGNGFGNLSSNPEEGIPLCANAREKGMNQSVLSVELNLNRKPAVLYLW